MQREMFWCQLKEIKIPTLAANAARVATYSRPASENVHAPLHNSYQHLQGRAHNTRLEAVGQETIDHYNQLFGEIMVLSGLRLPFSL